VGQKLEFLYLSAEDVRAAGGADLAATMAACEEAFRLFEAGECRELPTGKIHWNAPLSTRCALRRWAACLPNTWPSRARSR